MTLCGALALAVCAGLALPAASVRAADFSGDSGLPFEPVARLLREQRVTTDLRLDYFPSLKTLDENKSSFGVTGHVKALPALSENVNGKLEARMIARPYLNSSHTDFRWLEAYATIHFERVDLRVGKQIVAWGRADGINPTDNLTPRDFTVPLPFDEDQRFGTIGLKFDSYLSQAMTLTAFVTPFFQPSKLPLPSATEKRIEKRPSRTLSDSVSGLKLNKAGGDVDWSLSYVHGYSLLPHARVIGEDASGPIVELHYDRINVIGADFAHNFGRYGLRGEMAYFQTADKNGTNPDIKNPSLFWIIGADRTFFENLNINVQFFQRRVQRYQNPELITDPMKRDIAIRNAIVDNQQNQINNGVSLRVSDKWFSDSLQAELFAIMNLARHDSYVRPSLSYAFTDQCKATIGAELYRGAQQTTFGSLRSKSSAFAELRYSFY